MNWDFYKKSGFVVLLIFLVTFTTRLYFAFSHENLDYDAYFSIRQVESIKETGIPIFKDKLSYSGNLVIFSPLFYYLIAFFSIFLKTEIAGKIIQNLLISLIIPITYLTTKKITKNKTASIFSTLLVSFVPVLEKTIVSIEPFSLALPLMLLSLYYLASIDEKKNLSYFLLFTFFSALASPISIVLVPTFWIYLMLLRAEKVKGIRSAFEAIVFSTFLILLVQFLIYKKAFLMHGHLIIWQNIPNDVLNQYFSELDIIKTIAMIGVIQFVFGLYEIYRFSFNEKKSAAGIMVALSLSIGLLLWFKLIAIGSGLTLIAISMSVLSGSSFNHLLNYLKKTHFDKLRIFFVVLIVAISITTFLITTFSEFSKVDTVTNGQINAAIWLKENTVENAKIAATLDEGYLITAIANRRNIIDKNFLLRNDAAKRYEDIKKIFTTPYETEALELLNKYRTKYIFLSKKAQKEFGVKDIRYFNEKCFKLIYDDEVKIYKTWCDLD